MPIDWISLSDNEMPVMPATIFTSYPNTSFLIVSNNGLKQLSAKLFANAVKLKTLSLCDELFTRIANATFRSCPNLESLKVSNNRIAVIESNAFQGLSRLNMLDVTNNSIEVLHPMVLAPLTNLNVLIANSNKIKKLSSQLFLKNLRLLEVSFYRNQLVELPEDLFQANNFLKSLQFIDNLLTSARTYGSQAVYLEFNQIKKLQIDSGLNKLSIRHNFLEDIECASADLTTIDRAFFNNNSLTSLNCIRDMVNLTELEVSANKLIRPSQQAFAKLSKLQILEIFNQTRFTNVAAKIFSPLKTIASLKVDRLVQYRNLRQLFPLLSMVSLTTHKWNCSYTQQIVNVLSRQKIILLHNNYLDQQRCNINQSF